MSSDDVTGEGEETAHGEGLAEAVFEALGDEFSRRIVVEAASEVVTASSLADSLDIAPATVYRRLNQLSEFGLIREVADIHAGPPSETGYRADVDTLVLSLSSSGFELTQRDSDLEAALWLFLDRISIEKAAFSFDDGTATVTLSADDGTIHDLYESYRKLEHAED